ncbi:MAG: hypothetical protein LBS04_04710, partial [Tannerellaceae bacterium]|nr:hypothetical protein [Tannerellaceae bacterium]
SVNKITPPRITSLQIEWAFMAIFCDPFVIRSATHEHKKKAYNSNRACYNFIPTQLAKENTKFQYKVVQRVEERQRFSGKLSSGLALRESF